MEFPDLIVETQRRTGVSGLATKANYITRMAERHIWRLLRVSKMMAETEAETKEDTSPPQMDFPPNFITMNEIYPSNQTYPLRHLILNQIKNHKEGYSIFGETIYVTTPGKYTMYYYKSAPSIVDENTNWLLEDDPEIYLVALSTQVYADDGNVDSAMVSQNYLSSLIHSANHESITGMYSGAEIQRGRGGY